MSTNFQRVRRDFDTVWLHDSHQAHIVYYEPVPGIRDGFFQAYRASKQSDRPWSIHNKRIGTEDGFRSLEAAMAAVEVEVEVQS